MSLNGPTILLVEDNANDVLLIERAIRKAKLANPIQVATNGEEAIAYLAGDPPYADRHRFPLPILILLDLKLPRKSGLEVLEWLRGCPQLRRINVVVLTSSRESSDVNRAYDLGVNSYLVKPVSPDRLLEMMRTVGDYWLVLNERPDVGSD
jgi:CheY-like chemotaxis protein